MMVVSSNIKLDYNALQMNPSIIDRTTNKIAENYQAKQHMTIINGRTYQVDQNVFSPAIFLGTEWLTNNLIARIKGGHFLEVGVGCGCTLVEVLLSGKIEKAVGCDISEEAVANTKKNIQSYKQKAVVYVSDVFKSVPLGEKFDTIYWNFPFHPTNEENSTLGPIEKGVKNHNYESLITFFSDIQERLTKTATIFLGFSQIMGDINTFDKIASSFHLKWKIVAENQTGSICLINIQPSDSPS